MNYKMMGRFLAQILFLEGLFLLPPLLISLYLGETAAVTGFACTLALIAGLCLLLFPICKGAPSAFHATEGMVCVAMSWIVLSLVGCLPFWVSREIPHFIDAFFEIVSGFTTNGDYIL